MPKIIKNPILVQLEFRYDTGTWEVTPSVHYGVGATEYPEFNHRKGIPVELTPEQETAIKDFAKDVIYPQILTNEEIE